MLLIILLFICTVARFFKLVKIKGAQTFLKCGSEAIEEDATIKDVIKSALKHANGAVLGATVDQVAFIFIQIRDNHYAAPLPNPPIVVSVIIQAGSGTKRRRAPVYKKLPNISCIHSTSDKFFIILKIAKMGGEMTKQIISDVDLLGLMTQQNVI